jgi:UMF1 family MFS transporter
MKEDRRAVLSWCLYDWANSAFILTVVAGFFPVFFKTFWCAGVEPTTSTARLGFADAVGGLAVAVLSPFLGAIADAGRAKKKMLLFFLITGASSTIALFLIQKGDWVSALITFVVASIGFNSANLFYDSLLIDVAEKEQMDWVSSLGYSLGYLGCGLLFLLNVFMVSKPSVFHLSGAAQAVRYSFLTAAGWWAFFSIPLFLFVKEKKYADLDKARNLFNKSISNLKTTFVKILHNRALLLFLFAYWLYIDGLNTFVLMAVDFGMSIGLKSQALMTALLVVQFVAFPAALLFGWLSKRFGALAMILTGIAIYILVSGIGTFALRNQLDFIILAGVTGLAQGGVQALSRSYYGKIIPPSESAEYFGFLNVVSRFAVIIGPAVVGSVAMLTHKAGLESQLASRAGMSSVSILFVFGGVLLVMADKMMKRKVTVVAQS